MDGLRGVDSAIWRLGAIAACLFVFGCGEAVEESAVDEIGSALEEAGGHSGVTLPVRGVFGGYEHGRVWGWAQRLGDDTPVEVRIEIDGREVTTLIAGEPRRDLRDKGLHATGHAGFSAFIGEVAEDAAVDAFVEETRLTNAPCVVQGFGPVSSCSEGTSRGALDLHDGWLLGWAQIVGREAPVIVRIDVDGEPFERVVADLPRRDLVDKRLHATGTAGFRIAIGGLPAGAEIEAFVDETNEPLMGNPVVLPPRRRD